MDCEPGKLFTEDDLEREISDILDGKDVISPALGSPKSTAQSQTSPRAATAVEEFPSVSLDNNNGLDSGQSGDISHQEEMPATLKPQVMLMRDSKSGDHHRRTLLDLMMEPVATANKRMAAVIADATAILNEGKGVLQRQEDLHCSGRDSEQIRIGTDTQNTSETDTGDKHSISDDMRMRRGFLKDELTQPLSKRLDGVSCERSGISMLGKRIRISDNVQRCPTYEFDDTRYAKMNLRECPFSHLGYSSRWEGCQVIDVSDLSDNSTMSMSDARTAFLVFGCLVQKHSKKRARDGQKYAVWTLSNMQTGSDLTSKGSTAKKPFTSINCLVFGDAFDAHHTQVEGAVFALRSPKILPSQSELLTGRDEQKNQSTLATAPILNGTCAGTNPKESESRARKFSRRNDSWSGVCLKVRKREDIVFVGICKDYALCEKNIADSVECGAWFHKKLGSMCPRHSAQLIAKMNRVIRMDIGNQERPGLSRDALVGTSGPLDLTKDNVSQKLITTGTALTALQQASRKIPAESDRLKINRIRSSIQKSITHKRFQDTRENAISRKLPCNICKYRPRSSAIGGESTISFSDGRASSSAKYRDAVNVLLQLGFALNEAGGFDPPSNEVAQKFGLQLQRKAAAPTDEFSKHQSDIDTRCVDFIACGENQDRDREKRPENAPITTISAETANRSTSSAIRDAATNSDNLNHSAPMPKSDELAKSENDLPRSAAKVEPLVELSDDSSESSCG